MISIFQNGLLDLCQAAAGVPAKSLPASGSSLLEQEVMISRLLDDYGTSLLRFAYSYVHNMADAQELVQDVLLRYLKKAPEFSNEGAKKAWLLQICANLSKNKIRFNALRQTSPLDQLQEKELRNDPDLSYVWQAVKQLPSDQRSVIHLFYEEGYSTEEIALILKISPSSVRSRLTRARQKLKTILQEGSDFDEI